MRRLLALLALAAALPGAAAAQPALNRFGVEGGDFRAELTDGRVLRGADLVGAQLDFATGGRTLRLTIHAAEPDRGGFAPDVWLFTVTLRGADGAEREFCNPDPDGRRLVIPYPDANEPQGFGLTCSGGGAGKCMRMGYRPWAMAPDGVTSLVPYFMACRNLLRGAYGHPDRPWTRDGMRVEIFDRIGIQPADEDPGELRFEAGWRPEGAVCVAHPRVPENGSLARIAAQEPRLAGLTGPEACTEDRAAALGALVFNRSRPPG